MTDKHREELQQLLESLSLTLKNHPDNKAVQTLYPRWIADIQRELGV